MKDPPDPKAADGTVLLSATAAGDGTAAERVLPLVYEQLRRAAQLQMAGERTGHTLTATALVHEAYARLMSGSATPPGTRAQFFKAAAEAMRRILVEHARARARVKRGGDGRGRPAIRVPLRVADLVEVERDPEEILRLEEALRRLEGEDEDAAAVVRLRFFAGLSGDQTAEMLGLSPSTVDREWAYARARLFRLMQPEG